MDSPATTDRFVAAPIRTPRWMLWTGRTLSAIPILMLGGLGLLMLVHPDPRMTQQMAELGWPERFQRPLLVVEVACALLYAIPQTATLGAILITGYLGGAVATHLRLGEPTWPIAVAVGAIAWLGLFFRDARLRAILPWRR